MPRRNRTKAKRTDYIRRLLALSIVLALVLLFTWPYLRTAFLLSTIPVGRGHLGSLEDTISGTAVFAGGSQDVVALASGTLRFLVQDGESVRTGQAVAELVTDTVARALEDSLTFAKAELERYEKETALEYTFLSQTLNEHYKTALDLLFLGVDSMQAGAREDALDYEELLVPEEEIMAQGSRRLSEILLERARLSEGIQGIEAVLAASSVKVVAPASGFYSRTYSPVGDKFTVDNLSTKSASEIDSLAREAGNASQVTRKDGDVISTGDVVGRIVSGQSISFFMPVKTEMKPAVRAGAKVDLRIANEVVSAEIASISDGKPPGYSIIQGEIAVVPLECLVHAGVVDLTVMRRGGVVIPRKAIVTIDGRSGVFLVQKTYARFREVEVIMIKGDEAVVSGISEVDDIVLRAWSFLGGRRVR